VGRRPRRPYRTRYGTVALARHIGGNFSDSEAYNTRLVTNSESDGCGTGTRTRPAPDRGSDKRPESRRCDAPIMHSPTVARTSQLWTPRRPRLVRSRRPIPRRCPAGHCRHWPGPPAGPEPALPGRRGRLQTLPSQSESLARSQAVAGLGQRRPGKGRPGPSGPGARPGRGEGVYHSEFGSGGPRRHVSVATESCQERGCGIGPGLAIRVGPGGRRPGR
jgi:hypothetical protein